MGVQQLLLIVLSIIIIGVAITIGLHLFVGRTYRSNEQALGAEIQEYATRAIQWYKTPESIGGAGQKAANVTVNSLASFLGFIGPSQSTTSDNGRIRLTEVTGEVAQFEGIGVELKNGKHPCINTSIDLSTGNIIAVVSSVPE